MFIVDDYWNTQIKYQNLIRILEKNQFNRLKDMNGKRTYISKAIKDKEIDLGRSI